MGDNCHIIYVDEALGDNGLWTLTSANLPGLRRCGENLPSLRTKLPSEIKTLFERTDGLDVEIRPLLDNSAGKLDGAGSTRSWAASPIAAHSAMARRVYANDAFLIDHQKPMEPGPTDAQNRQRPLPASPDGEIRGYDRSGNGPRL